MLAIIVVNTEYFMFLFAIYETTQRENTNVFLNSDTILTWQVSNQHYKIETLGYPDISTQ